MATFKNIVTGNLLTTEEPDVIKLMRESERYVEVMTEKAAKQPAAKPSK